MLVLLLCLSRLSCAFAGVAVVAFILGARRFSVFIRAGFQSVVAVCCLAAGVVFLVLPDWVSVFCFVFGVLFFVFFWM